MLRIKKRIRIMTFSLLLTVIILIGICSTVKAAETTYESALTRGTDTLIVSQYDEGAWEDIIDDELEPDDWFGGDADKIGAKSRITIKSMKYDADDDLEWHTYKVLEEIFDVYSYLPEEIIEYQLLAFMANFTKDSINERYSNKYDLWQGVSAKWDFTDEANEDFEDVADDRMHKVPIFKDPGDFKDMLEDYNDWVVYINVTMVSLGLESYPILSEEEFLWQLIISGTLTIASPFNRYLSAVVDELDCKDVEVKDSKIIIEKNGEEDYTVEVTYGNRGTQSSLIVKDDDGDIIYEITSEDTTTIILIILGVMATAIAGIVYVAVIIRKKNREI